MSPVRGPDGPTLGDAPSDRHPGGEAWRADSLARSHHSRLDELRQPLADFGEEKAAALCAEVCRGLLGDFAPALLLLPPFERRRAQALVAYAATLWDFARQRGIDGEKLAEINRFEFTLDAALGGEPVGQPIFLRLARENERRRLPVEPLAELAAAARRRATRERPASAAEVDADAERLGRAMAGALLGHEPAPELAAFAGALVRVGTLQRLGSELAGARAPSPPPSSPPTAGARRRPRSSSPPPAASAGASAHACCAPRVAWRTSPPWRRVGTFSLLAALRLLTLIEDADARLLTEPPRLGVAARLGLLARARWLGGR